MASSPAPPNSSHNLMSILSESEIPMTSQLDPTRNSAPPSSAMEMEDDGRGGPREDFGNQRQRNTTRQVPKVLDKPGLQTSEEFYSFLMEFQIESHLIYRVMIMELEVTNITTLWVNFDHVRDYNEGLAILIQNDYVRFEPFLVRALVRAVEELAPQYLKQDNSIRDFALAFHDVSAKKAIRSLTTNLCAQLISFEATVTRTSIVRPELVEGTFQCEDCDEIIPNVRQEFVFTRPQVCPNDFCNNTENWKLLTEKCKFVDWQKCRVQENANDIPPGSVPRSMDVIVRGEMCEKPKPGDVCVFTGSLIAVPEVAQLLMAGRHLNVQKSIREAGRSNKDAGVGGQGVSGMKALGCREMSFRLIFIANSISTTKDKYAHYYDEANVSDESSLSDTIAKLLTPEQREEMLRMIDSKTNYEDLIASIAPTVYGHSRIKEGLLLLLLGGVHKKTPEGTNKLRGDINVCVVGDPGLSKSQFLKYISTLLPRGIYTSGKASSAAGLTAGVVKDEETGDFCIEAGALMLADNGICCIDEFDKMDIKDQVAIHEAMEQQTISIAKAGIHATLNARTSILAAANPVGGRYDKGKSLRYNVNMSPAIMSRFDLFFVVLDQVDEDHDYELAKHILRINRELDEAIQPKYSADTLRRFILFARALKPKITEGAKHLLIKKYQALRQKDSQGKNGYHITVRQLESLIRLSEAMARAQVESEVREKHVKAAADLLQNSIIQTERGDVDLEDGSGDAELPQEEGDEVVAQDGQEQEPVKPKMKLRADEYLKIVRSVLIHIYEEEQKKEMHKTEVGQMRDEEDVEMDANNEMRYAGIKFEDICTWYLKERESAMQNEEEYFDELKKIRNVLKRMVKHDRYLMALRPQDDDESAAVATGMFEDVKLTDESLLVVSPNVTLEELE